MKLLLKNGSVFTARGFIKKDVVIAGGRVSFSSKGDPGKIVDCSHLFLIPGLVDVHVHLREPGFFYKETIAAGTRAAARGGYTAVCAMPNLDPAPSTPENLQAQLDIIKADAAVKVYPYGTITGEQNGRGGLADLEGMKDRVVAYSDDGKGVQTAGLMEEAMRKAKTLGKIIAAHCEDEALLDGGYIHQGAYAARHGHPGICSESEWGQVRRDIGLCEKTGASYHVCHVSTKESVELIRRAKKDGLPVTCETAPHYLVFCDEDLREDGAFKMNPPIRSAEDRKALLTGIQDGTIDMIATDHAPHSAEEKNKGLKDSAFGITGLETAFPVLYTCLVKTGRITLEKLIDLMALAPRRVFGLEGGCLAEGQTADLAVWDLDHSYRIDPGRFLSKGRSTPFAGMEVRGEAVMTLVDGSICWEKRDE